MDITVAYFHALLHPDVLKQDFEQIRSTGANSIVYAVHEQEEQRGPRDFERGLRQARDAGLKIQLSLGRFRQSLCRASAGSELVHLSPSSISCHGPAWALSRDFLL